MKEVAFSLASQAGWDADRHQQKGRASQVEELRGTATKEGQSGPGSGPEQPTVLLLPHPSLQEELEPQAGDSRGKVFP